MQDKYNTGDDRYAYRLVEGDTDVEDGPVASSLLKGNLRPWPRGSYADSPVTTRTGVLARKIGVVPMWQSDGKPISATMLHVSTTNYVTSSPVTTYRRLQLRCTNCISRAPQLC